MEDPREKVKVIDDFSNNLKCTIEIHNNCSLGAFLRALRKKGIWVYHEEEVKAGLAKNMMMRPRGGFSNKRVKDGNKELRKQDTAR